MAGRHLRTHTLTAALAAFAVLATGCAAEDDGSSGPDDTEQPDEDTDGDGGYGLNGGDGGVSSAAPATGSAEVAGTVAENLPSPWGLVAAPDGNLLLTSRDEATISRIDPDSGDRTELASIEGVDTTGEAGLLGLALDDDGDWLYAYYTAESDNRVVRMAHEEDGDGLGAPEVVLDGIPKDPVVHHGGGLSFGPDGMLYASTGDAGEPDLSQDEDSLAGKILRMTPDGEVPEDNPEDGSYVWSLGHRNVQGLAWDYEDRLWASEFGADELDELNLIEPGGNYGWPEHEGSGGEDDGYLDPEAEWPVDEASPSGLAYAEGSLWMAGLRGERLWRIPLDEEGSAGEPQDFLEGEYGRLRSVVAVGDGELLLATNETDTRGEPEEDDDRLLRLDVS